MFLAASTLHDTPRDTDEAVSARMRRQKVLRDASKRIELLMSEAALLLPIAPRGVMLAQIDRLLTLDELPALRLGVIPANRQLPALLEHGLGITDNDSVTVELGHTEIESRDPADLELYNKMADLLWSIAVEGDEARTVLSDCAERLREQTRT